MAPMFAFMGWEYQEENPPARLGDHMTISHAPLGIETRLQQ